MEDVRETCTIMYQATYVKNQNSEKEYFHSRMNYILHVVPYRIVLHSQSPGIVRHGARRRNDDAFLSSSAL